MPFFGFGYSASSTITQSSISAGGTDSDAQAFIDAAGITDSTQQSAINTLVTDLKTANIWTKMKAVYPFVGASSTSHKYNLVNPVDSDAAFRLSFSTGWTHSSTGATPNGSSAYADTFLNPTTSLSSSNNHASIYNRTNTAGTFSDLGSYTVSGLTYYFIFRTRQTGDTFLIGNGNSSFPTAVNTDSRGFYLMSKTSASNTSGFKNNSKVINEGVSGTGISNHNVFIGAINANGTAAQYTNREISFASLGNGLTDTEASDFNTAVTTFQTTLSRNV